MSEIEQNTDFIRTIINEDLKNNKNDGKIHTRFPPEPNGYLHIGHAKSICLNFGISSEYSNGLCNLRFDDTNPSKESIEYAESIKKDVKWLDFDWDDRLYYTSDYFNQLFQYALQLIKKDKAYVCSLSTDEIREFRGTLTEPGKNSTFRERTIEENLDLFHRMKKGEFDEGSHVLRAKIDMASPNLIMRDPTLYRIKKVSHHRTEDDWCIYPMYDFAHCLSDSIEGITHSICTLEFENNRPLYDWILDELELECHPQQIEFARLNLNYTVLSKRKLIQLVEQQYVRSWDDPRMPTISGLRRRGYSSDSIRKFCERIGVAKRDSVVDVALLEHCVREDLNNTAPRVMAVLKPLKVILTNFPEDDTRFLEFPNHPSKKEMGSRKVPFSKILYIEQEDFMENPPKKFFRLAPGREVRLRYAYFIKCEKVIKDDSGEIIELHCTYDPETHGGNAPDGRKVKATLHWLSAAHCKPAEVRLYNHLFNKENPEDVEKDQNFTININPGSEEILTDCMVEPSLADAIPGNSYQFERLGYFYLDSVDNKQIFNRTVTLRDTWAKIKKKQK